MELTNERVSNDVIYDIDLDEKESKFLIEYGKEHISDAALIQFAVVDILTKKMVKCDLGRYADIVNDVLANAAELGCPKDEDVDMWYRNLSDDEQCEIISRTKEIQDRYTV